MARTRKAREDKRIALVPGPDPDIKEFKEEFINGDYICHCIECGREFRGREDSFLCLVCLKEIHYGG